MFDYPTATMRSSSSRSTSHRRSATMDGMAERAGHRRGRAQCRLFDRGARGHMVRALLSLSISACPAFTMDLRVPMGGSSQTAQNVPLVLFGEWLHTSLEAHLKAHVISLLIRRENQVNTHTPHTTHKNAAFVDCATVHGAFIVCIPMTKSIKKLTKSKVP